MTHVRRELLEADDTTIEDAVRYADPMVLRGLLYQLSPEYGLLPGWDGPGSAPPAVRRPA